MDRSVIIIALLDVRVGMAHLHPWRLEKRLVKLRTGQSLIIDCLICGEPGKSPEGDPDHSEDQPLG